MNPIESALKILKKVGSTIGLDASVVSGLNSEIDQAAAMLTDSDPNNDSAGCTLLTNVGSQINNIVNQIRTQIGSGELSSVELDPSELMKQCD
jgi:hypothetical protein